MPNAFLDAKGLNCPLPILRAKKAMQALDIGGLLDIHATDPGAVKDFAAFCRSTGNELLSFRARRQCVQVHDQTSQLERRHE